MGGLPLNVVLTSSRYFSLGFCGRGFVYIVNTDQGTQTPVLWLVSQMCFSGSKHEKEDLNCGSQTARVHSSRFEIHGINETEPCFMVQEMLTITEYPCREQVQPVMPMGALSSGEAEDLYH